MDRDVLIRALTETGGTMVSPETAETLRIETGIGAFGKDMDETNVVTEANLDDAVSFTKGCYIGQEVIARIRTYGQVTKALRGLQFADSNEVLPKRGDKLYRGDKEIGYITSATASPTLRSNIALAYVRREHNEIGTELLVRTGSGNLAARIVLLPRPHG